MTTEDNESIKKKARKRGYRSTKRLREKRKDSKRRLEIEKRIGPRASLSVDNEKEIVTGVEASGKTLLKIKKNNRGKRSKEAIARRNRKSHSVQKNAKEKKKKGNSD